MSQDNSLDHLIQHRNYKQAFSDYYVKEKSARDWYNIGNCAYMADEVPSAITAWTIAYRKGIKEGDLSAVERSCLNLESHADDYYEAEKPSSLSILDNCYGVVSIIPLWFWLLTNVMVLLALCWYIFSFQSMYTFRIWILCLLWCSLLIPVGIYYLISTTNRFIATRSADMLRGPNSTFSKCAVIKIGEQGYIEKKDKDFYLVSMHDKRGWVDQDSIGVI